MRCSISAFAAFTVSPEAEFEGAHRHSVKGRRRVVQGALHEVVEDVPFVVPSHVQVSARQLTSVAVRNRGLTLLHVSLSDFKLAEGANLTLLVQAYHDNRRYKVWCTRYTIKLSCCSTHLMANNPLGYRPT